MKKALSLALVFVLIFALAVPAMAAPKVPDPPPEEGARTAVMLDKNPFHCNTNGGNGRAYSAQFEKELAAAGKKGSVALNLVYIGDNAWLLDSDKYACDTCGNTEWASFSNKSGVPDGKNMQFTHPAKKEVPPPEEDNTVYGLLVIQKTVGGVSFDEWAADKGLTFGEIADIIDGMKFTAYQLDGKDGNRIGSGIPGNMEPSGAIAFGGEVGIEIGWYQVVEEISGTAVDYFVDEGEGGVKVYYVGEKGTSSEISNWISGQDGVGTVISAEQGDRNWILPNVWNGQLWNDSNFQKLMGMGAQWIWDVEDTYWYGVNGSTYSDTFKLTLAEEIEVPIYFAADNVALIYVNGKLAAFTDVALLNRGVKIGDDYDENVLDTLSFDNFDGRWSEGWAHVYNATITLGAGENVIDIIAANSSSAGHYDGDTFVPGNTGTDNDTYNYLNNPCGVIFGFEIPAVTFDNTPIEEQVVYGDVTVNVDFDVKQDTVTYEPIYERTIKDTLVSVGLNAGNGGYDMGNWHTYVEIDVEAAKAGYDIEIAKSGSGKYGFEGIGYFYNVKIEDDQLIVSFDDKLISASYGAYIVNEPKDFPGSAPKHPGTGASYSFDLPENYSETVYMYFHLASLTWDDGITLKGWKEVSRVTNDVDAVVTDLTVELWLGDELIDSQDLDDTLPGNYSFWFGGDLDLDDGEYTVVIKGTVNGEDFEKTDTVIIENNSSETVDFLVEFKLADIDIKVA